MCESRERGWKTDSKNQGEREDEGFNMGPRRQQWGYGTVLWLEVGVENRSKGLGNQNINKLMWSVKKKQESRITIRFWT